MTDKKKIVMSGMRPTGRLHLGNYWGALKNWVALQNECLCYFSVADWHMLTTGYEDTGALQLNIREMVLDWLAAGLDPEKCVIFKQSDIREHAELALLLSMITPLSWLENNPTWKEQLQELARTKESKLRAESARASGKTGKAAADAEGGASVGTSSGTSPTQRSRANAVVGAPGAHVSAGVAATGDSTVETAAGTSRVDPALRTHGFLGYPVLQAADILIYGAEVVPVGQDQLPHVELSREIARRFNSIYGPVLKEPQPRLTPTPKIPGIDGRKMSKSYGNAVDIFETSDSLKTKVLSMYTDPKKIRADDPGHPLPCPDNEPGCVVFALHQLYSSYAPRREIECKEGRIGCVACKKDLLQSLDVPFADFRQARERYGSRPGSVEKILEDGAATARKAAQQTMEKVRKAMHLARK